MKIEICDVCGMVIKNAAVKKEIDNYLEKEEREYSGDPIGFSGFLFGFNSIFCTATESDHKLCSKCYKLAFENYKEWVERRRKEVSMLKI